MAAGGKDINRIIDHKGCRIDPVVRISIGKYIPGSIRIRGGNGTGVGCDSVVILIFLELLPVRCLYCCRNQQ